MAKGLYLIVLIAWLLVIFESYVLFAFIIPASPRIHSVGAFTLVGIGKVLATLLLGVIWFLVIGFARALYVRIMEKKK